MSHILEHKCKTYFSALGNRCRVFLSQLTYDDKGNVETVTAPDHTEAFAYDELDQTMTSKTISINEEEITYEYAYKPTANNALDSITADGNIVRPNTDALGRNTGKTIGKQYTVDETLHENTISEEKISYVKFGDHATNMPSNVRFATNGVFNESIQYKYDSMGNIIEVFENGRTACRYEYDAPSRYVVLDIFTECTFQIKIYFFKFYFQP